MSGRVLHHRLVLRRLAEALEDSPIVLIHGPRQCGKTTLAQVGYAPTHLPRASPGLVPATTASDGDNPRPDYAYITLDDIGIREGARADPMGFVADLPERVILDEVQRAPELFAALKLEVDRRRVPGRFILTGSTNVLLVPTLSDSLAGRLEIVRLHPLAQAELARPDGRGPSLRMGGSFADAKLLRRERLAGIEPATRGFLDAMFGAGFETRQGARLGRELHQRIVSGGFPAALARPTESRRGNWYRNYVETQVGRDIRDLARIRAPEVLSRLLNAASAQTATLYNLSNLASPLELSRPTVGDYVALLERLFLLERLPPWHSNRLSRLVKTPKLHLGDTGLGAALLGVDAAALATDRAVLGQLLETFVYQELRRQASWSEPPTAFFHFRDRDGAEVDIVMQRGPGTFAGLEVKASATVTRDDFRGLRKLADALGERLHAGVVLYDGETVVPFGERLRAVPIRRLWEP